MKDYQQDQELLEEMTDAVYFGDLTINEARAKLGLPPLEGAEMDRVVNWLRMEQVENDCC